MSTPLMRVCAVKDEVAWEDRDFASAQPVFLLGQDDDAGALRSLVGEGESLRCLGKLLLGDAGRGKELHGLAITHVIVPVLSRRSTSTSPALPPRDRSSRAHSSGPGGRCQPMPMALSRPPMVVGMRQTSSDTRTGIVKLTLTYTRSLQREEHHEEDKVKCR